MLGISPSSLRRLERDGQVEGYALTVHYTPGGQRRYRMDQIQAYLMRRGFAARLGTGAKPAVMVLDLTKGFTDPESPLGFNAAGVINQAAELLWAARASGIPIAFSLTEYDPEAPVMKLWTQKLPALRILEPGSEWVKLDKSLGRRPSEPVFCMPYLSHLSNPKALEFLERCGADTLVLAGVSTSGGVRHTVVSALEHGYRCIIPLEAVGDRSASAHMANLSDLDTKYADVMPVTNVIRYLHTRQAG